MKLIVMFIFFITFNCKYLKEILISSLLSKVSYIPSYL